MMQEDESYIHIHTHTQNSLVEDINQNNEKFSAYIAKKRSNNIKSICGYVFTLDDDATKLSENKKYICSLMFSKYLQCLCCDLYYGIGMIEVMLDLNIRRGKLIISSIHLNIHAEMLTAKILIHR